MNDVEIRNWIWQVLHENKAIISEAAFSDIYHYITHSEYEIAFEFLMLELMEVGSSGLNGSDVLLIARSLGLDKDYHYDMAFWDKLTSYFKNIKD